VSERGDLALYSSPKFVVSLDKMQGQGSGGSSKKSSQMTMGTMGLMIFGLAVILLGFNYWHAMKCVESSGMGDLEDYAKAIDKRVLEIESKVRPNMHYCMMSCALCY
jgi:hypothetical protein